MADQSSRNRDTGEPTMETARGLLGNGMLSVIMPARNLGSVISTNVARVRSVLEGRMPFEIVVVDDGSTDDTAARLREAAEQYPELRPVLLPENVGKGAAIMRGFDSSRGTLVLLLDADLDLPPEQIAGFFEIMAKENADVVIGSKRHPDSRLTYPWHRRLTSAVYFALVKLLLGLPIKDTQTGIKLFKREVLEWVFTRCLVKRFAFDLEVLAIAHGNGYRIAESPVTLKFRGTWGCVHPAAVRQILKDTLAIFYRTQILKYYRAIPGNSIPDPPPLVSVVVAFPAATAHLDECIAAIGRQTYKNYQVILLPDESCHRTFPNGFREIPTGKIRPAEKRNVGIEKAQGKLIAFLDDDAFPRENWLHYAVAHFSNPDVAAVGGPATTPESDSYMASMSGSVYANRAVSGSYRYRYVPDRVREVDDYPSSNLIVRTEVLRDIGGFRTDFWPGEDTYLCMEITRRLKKKIVYDPRVHVFHHRRRLFGPHLRQIARYALHRGYFARKFPATSRRVSYMMPSFLVAGILAGGVAAAAWAPLRPLYLGALAFYLLTTLALSMHGSLTSWLLVWLGTVLTHLVYGVRFVWGLCSSTLPDHVAAFDHPSETSSPA